MQGAARRAHCQPRPWLVWCAWCRLRVINRWHAPQTGEPARPADDPVPVPSLSAHGASAKRVSAIRRLLLHASPHARRTRTTTFGQPVRFPCLCITMLKHPPSSRQPRSDSRAAPHRTRRLACRGWPPEHPGCPRVNQRGSSLNRDDPRDPSHTASSDNHNNKTLPRRPAADGCPNGFPPQATSVRGNNHPACCRHL
jgi:hypothetical protein